MAEKRKMDLSPEEIERRSKLAKELGKRKDPINGRRMFSGHQPGAGRPKKQRATEVMNQEIEKNAKTYWQQLHNIAMHDKSAAIRIQALNALLAITNKETDIQTREDRNLDNTSTEELVEIVSSRLARLAQSGKIDFDFEGSAEDVAEELPELNEGSSDEDEQKRSSGNGATSSGFGTSPFARRTTKQ